MARWREEPHDCTCHFCGSIRRIERLLADIAMSLEIIATELSPTRHNAVGGTITLGPPSPK